MNNETMIKIIDYIDYIINEIIEYFRFCPFTLYNYSYNKKMDKEILNFITRDINKVVIDSFLMYLFSEDEFMSVWISNRWYAFGSEINIGKFNKTESLEDIKLKKYSLKDFEYDPNTKTLHGRPSFKALRMLKYIYLKNGGVRWVTTR